jgi:Kdo2-lipid IVA lauroyltransferase/acyltransferase
MTAVIYFLFVWPISRLPMGLLYRLSDLLFLIVYSGVRYRRSVVAENLARSFPEKSSDERLALARDFYQHFCDLIVESFKGFTISSREIQSRFRVLNPEVLEPFFKAGRPVIIAGGHYNSWEWLAIGLRQQILHRAVAIYKPLSNVFLDSKMRETRGKYGLEMLAMKAVPRFFRAAAADANTVPYAMIFGCDQSPGDPRKAHWMTFLGQDTGVTFGAEKYAREYDHPVFYGVVRKVSRGMYTFELKLITDRPREAKTGEIIETVMHLLEDEIRKDPRYWLWTHRRWKHKRPSDVR